MSNYVILGAADPEMRAIETLVRACGVTVAYATVDGVRVHPGNAYRANGVIGTDGLPVDLAQWVGERVCGSCGYL